MAIARSADPDLRPGRRSRLEALVRAGPSLVQADDIAVELDTPVDIGPGVECRVEFEHGRDVSRRITEAEAWARR